MSYAASHPELSLVLPIRNGEETVGREIRAAASHLTALGRTFEIVAVNDGCRDNSLSIVQLIARDLPQVRLVCRDVSGRAFVRGATEASGSLIVLVHGTERVGTPWAPLGWALSRVETAGMDGVVLRGRYIVARRLPALPTIARARGRNEVFERDFERQAFGLSLDVVGSRRPAPSLLAPVRRLLAWSDRQAA